ncbi:hypothetical protein B4135_3529 [Caldibacillus debilis]|uniref:Uncharacterized protein n=1 Tax=Caldibacillus debilis TaxID=301148 RepID=A0A150LDL5_9BACI|nr:hypothetical protein B4135_3529 [Caldibacillus debilis]
MNLQKSLAVNAASPFHQRNGLNVGTGAYAPIRFSRAQRLPLFYALLLEIFFHKDFL